MALLSTTCIILLYNISFALDVYNIYVGTVDTALYPILAYRTMVAPFTEDVDNVPWIGQYLIKLVITTLWTIPLFFRVNIIGNGLFLLIAVVMLPFVIYSFCVIPQVNVSNLLSVSENATYSEWFTLLNVLYWNLSGFDCISTVAGEVMDPARTLPKALFYAMGLMMISCQYMKPRKSS